MTTTTLLAHRTLAFFLGIFIVSHLGIHLTAIAGIQTHLDALNAAKAIYKNPIVEPVLVIAILVQVFMGVRLLLKRWSAGKLNMWGRIQVASGVYLTFFLLLHTTASLTTGYFVGVETNFYWAAATLSVGNLVWFFAPYYTLAIIAFFAHISAAIYFATRSQWKPVALTLIGVIVAGIIVSTFAGLLYDITLPAEYIALFESY